jgi:chemotaxis protein histidine kinase CheA
MSSVAMTFDISAATMARVQDSFGEFGLGLVKALSEKYGFSAEEAIVSIGLDGFKLTTKKGGRKATGEKKEKVPKKNKPSVLFLFVGVVCEDDCKGIKINHQLHTQCLNSPMESGDYCKTCQKQADGNASGKPNAGDIRDRLTCDLLEFRDPKGRQTLPYANVVAKLGLDMDTCLEEAEKFGVSIPEEQFIVRETRRGRPKKNVEDVSDTDSDAPKRKRGRPRKEKKVEAVVGDDLLSALAAAEKNAEKVDEKNDSGNESDASSVKSGETKVSKRGRKALTEEEKAERLAKKEALKKAREEERAAKKAQKEAEKAELKKMREAEKEAKKAAMLAKKEEAKKAKEAEKEAKKAAMEAEKKAKEEAEKAPRNAPESVSPEEEEKESSPVEAEGAAKVEKFEFEGVTYLKDEDDVVYDMKTHDVVGLWDAEENKIDTDVAFASDDEEDDE